MAKLRNDDYLEKKWSGARVLRTELNRWDDPGLNCSGDPGKTDKSQAEDCDINKILKKYQQTGVLKGVNARALYADVSDPVSYHEAMNIVAHAQEQFDSLDAFTRKRFGNDPAEFLAFASDSRNVDEMVKLGLAIPKAAPSIDEPAPAAPGGSKPPSGGEKA